MGSYFVVLHSTPEGGGQIRRKFVLELAKRLGRKEQDIDILLTDLPAVVTASPTKDFAVALCLAIENLGGLAETMSEVSGVHMALSPGAGDKPAFKPKIEPPEPVKEKPGGPLKPVESLDLSLSFEDSKPTKEAAVTALLDENTPDAPDFQPPEIEDVSKLLDEVLTADPSESSEQKEPEVPVLAEEPPVKETMAPAPPNEKKKSAAKQDGKKAAKSAAAKPKEDESAESTPEEQKKTKSKSTLAVISAFAQKEVSLPKKAKSSATDKTDASGDKKPALALQSDMDEGEFETRKTVGEPSHKPITLRQQCLYGFFVIALLAYIAVLIHPEFILGTQEKEVSVNISNIKALLKQQDKILEEMKNKPVSDTPKVFRDWSTEEISGQGSFSLTLGSSDTTFDSGTLTLTTPPAAPLTPEEYSRGVTPRVWIKELVVEKLRKTGKPNELSGKAKITIADERSLDKIVATVLITVQIVEETDVATGSLEVFFPSVTAERPPTDIVQREPQGQVRIYYRKDFTTRVNPTPDKSAAASARSAKQSKGKGSEPLPLPVI